MSIAPAASSTVSTAKFPFDSALSTKRRETPSGSTTRTVAGGSSCPGGDEPCSVPSFLVIAQLSLFSLLARTGEDGGGGAEFARRPKAARIENESDCHHPGPSAQYGRREGMT